MRAASTSSLQESTRGAWRKTSPSTPMAEHFTRGGVASLCPTFFLCRLTLSNIRTGSCVGLTLSNILDRMEMFLTFTPRTPSQTHLPKPAHSFLGLTELA
jgi:hypothetical protein